MIQTSYRVPRPGPRTEGTREDQRLQVSRPRPSTSAPTSRDKDSICQGDWQKKPKLAQNHKIYRLSIIIIVQLIPASVFIVEAVLALAVDVFPGVLPAVCVEGVVLTMTKT